MDVKGRASPSPEFTLPETFRPGEFLKGPQFLFAMDAARYLISLILTKMARGQADRRGFVRLLAKYLRNVMGRHMAKAIIDALVDGGAIERDAYEPGARSSGFRLADRYKDDRHVRVRVTDRQLLGRMEAATANADADQRAHWKPVHSELERQQSRYLGIDGDAAREILAGLPPASNPYDAQGILIAKTENGNFHLAVGDNGRVSNNITSLNRQIRKTLRLDGQPVASVDVSCAQPALLALLIKQETNQGTRTTQGGSIYDGQNPPPIGRDYGVYTSLVRAGQLYEAVCDDLRRHGISMCRDALKKRVMTDVIGKKGKYPSAVEDAFRRLFPSVHQFVRRVNRDGQEHCNLIRRLQRMESWLVIETVAADLMSQHPSLPVITLHDAIYTTPSELPRVVDGFKRVFDRIGFSMALKTIT